MRLGTTEPVDLPVLVGSVLDRRLASDSPRPVALAFSGGGDSLALLLAAVQWAEFARRRLLVLTVDHGLNPNSAAWTRGCAEVAAGLGASFRALRWDGPRPAAGLPAAARQARHRLLAEAAREAGARVLLLGHTADDRLETEAMRAAGSTTPQPREWAPSPAWPDGRGLFLLRPLLERRRSELRDWLAARGERWIDDPANDDLRFARARARARLSLEGEPSPLGEDRPLAPARQVREPAPGLLQLAREDLRAASTGEAARLLALMAVCAGGGVRPPSSDSLSRAAQAFRGSADATLPLAGARLEADAEHITVSREAGEAARGGLQPLIPEPGEPVVWDGRFEVEAVRPGLTVRALAGRMARLGEPERRTLATIAAAARPSLPAVVDASGNVSCPYLAPSRDVAVRSLVLERFVAAAGLVEREPT